MSQNLLASGMLLLELQPPELLLSEPLSLEPLLPDALLLELQPPELLLSEPLSSKPLLLAAMAEDVKMLLEMRVFVEKMCL